MRILVTGSSGFIGGHLVRRLAAEGHQVAGLDKREPPPSVPGLEHYGCDLLDRRRTREVLREVQPEVVFHLAARTDLHETRDLGGYAANIAGVENLLEAIGEAGSVRRSVCTSTQLVSQNGFRPAGDEDYNPSTLYGQSKVRTERIWRAGDGAGTEWCLVRPTTIWGPWMNPHYLTFFRMLRQGRYFHVGRTPIRKAFGFVGNTVHQYIRLMEAPPDQVHRRVFYLADYEPMTIQEWAEAFRQALGGPPIRSIPLPVALMAARVGDLVNWMGIARFPFNSFRLRNVLTVYQMDVSDTRAVCGPLPCTLADGVTETARWVREVLAEAA